MTEAAGEPERLVPSNIRGIHHVGMAVRDLAAAVDFYRAGTELDTFSRSSISGELPLAPDKTAVLKGPNGYLQLMQFPSAETAEPSRMPVEGPGATHVCFQSPAPLARYQTFASLGATPVSRGKPPVDLNGRGVRYAYARDADHIMFEVEQLDEPRFDGPIWIAHIALACHDIDRSVDFYQRLLGVEPYGRANKVTGPRFDEVTGIDEVRIRAAWFNTGNMVLELWQFVNPVTPAPGQALPFDAIGYNKFALETVDLDKECHRLRSAGVKLLNEPSEVNGVREVYARDPDGNLFSLLQAGPAAAATVEDLQMTDWLPSPASAAV